MTREKRTSSVSFGDKSEDNVQLSIAPHIQKYLSRVSQESGCWGKFLPIPFERAASKSWWDPTFDSDILEEQYRKSCYPYNRLKFRYALWYVLLISLSWFFYFLSTGITSSKENWLLLCTILVVVAFVTVAILLLTYRDFFNTHLFAVSFALAVILCGLSLLLLSLKGNFVTPVGHFSICIEILLLIYTVIPLKLYLSLTLALLYSALFEVSIFLQSHDTRTILVRVLLHVCIHLIGLHISIMTNIRVRNTFMKVGQSLLVGQQLIAEKNLKESMLHSLMPPKVARWLLDEDERFAKNGRNNSNETTDMQSLFRPFNMNRMENVSILFADIVGFTKISSAKTAEELVDVLNKLFQKFDGLCKKNNCEKIATLGDCYYCVSGCPEPRIDHAKCCVEMGLDMIQAIRQFDEEHSEGVNMRVGVHTGTVLCGIVGTRRFKFDVWSNDVSLANRMESTGKPGMVHVSENTAEFLRDVFLFEEGEHVFGLKTYFILGRKSDKLPSYNGSFKAYDRRQTIQPESHSLQLIISPPSSPPAIPSPQSRPRVLSCDHSAIQILPQNPNMLSPDVCRIKASSLPSILDEQEIENDKDSGEGSEAVKTPTSTASSGRYSVKIKNWKIPGFLKKAEKTGGDATNEPFLIQVPAIVESCQPSVVKVEEPIDVKSYISQSRSDVGHYDEFNSFMRSSSYKSPYPRPPNLLSRAGSNRSRRGHSPIDILPVERCRSATVAMGTLERPRKSIDCQRLSTIFVDDQVSMAYSVNSRKDSGIKSNSRRSSLQQLDNHLPIESSKQRASDYFTSSQSSIVPPSIERSSGLFFEKYGCSIHNLRKQSDLQLIKCVQRNSESERSYFIKAPVSKVTLFFKNKKMEHDYRSNVYSFNEYETLANFKFNTYFDVFVSVLVFLGVSLCLFLLYSVTLVWLIFFAVFVTVQICAIALCCKAVIHYTERVLTCCSRWYRWNAFGGVLVSLPVISVLCNFVYASSNLYSYLFFVSLIHFCNFTQLNCWMKNFLATIFGSLFVCLSLSKFCLCLNDLEIVMDLSLLLILVWLLNREFEICYRLSFHANFVSNRDKIHVQHLKNQADWLIYNIVPEHVADLLKKNAKYSENFKDVAVIFASIVNFNEMYDESYLGGKEFLRVLNELIGDFDELLTLPEFRSVDKIKTIGSTFMAASGLNSASRASQRDPNEHLYALMDFAVAMQNVVSNFNRDLLEFNLVLRIGYNFGDVTAAVIGNTKLYYDIWGDAVNIASRMDSTGVNGRIQVGENCLDVLETRYAFEKRGSIYVKGKDNMNVYLLIEKKNPEIEETSH